VSSEERIRPIVKQDLPANMENIKGIKWKKIRGWRFCSSKYNFLKVRDCPWKFHSQIRQCFTHSTKLNRV